ncbi:MAG: TolC family protein [Flavobacteriales bacterium]|jgi:outer membrane protein|nr:TolC family protein [Flavobacteriales bacterium]
MYLTRITAVAFAFILSFVSAETIAQEEWTLERCISYALEHNIQIKQSALQQESARLDKTQSLAQLFPNLNASTGFNTNFGRTIDPGSNSFVTDQVNSNNFSIGSSVTLFNGFRLLNSFKQSQTDLLAAEYDLQGLSNDISMNIATAFMQIMFSEELQSVAEQQLEVTKQQLERTKKLVDAGSLPAGNLYDVEAQLASNELQVINTENALSSAVLTLKQMLNLPASESFRIKRPLVDTPIETLGATTVGTVYDHALNNWPKIKARETRLESAQRGEKIAFANYTPTISANASVSTLFSSAYKNSYLDSSFNLIREDIPYGKQLDQNLSERVGFTLNIPIFNGLQSRTGVHKARLSRMNAELQLQDQKNQLYSSVQQAYNDATSAKRQYDASDKSVNAMEKAFEYSEQRFNVGMMNTLEFNTSSNNLTRSRSELLRSKYDYIFKMKVLDFYQGKPITFDSTK